MKTITIKFIILGLIMLKCVVLNSQTLSEKQMQNARATGYSIVSSRNPGVSFSIFMIPWDGLNSLETNANQQINSGWHAQAAIKGNYFYQEFDGSDFTQYSSVVLSQEEFDLYKNIGTQWWIVCSTLPPFSENSSFKGNVGIGTTAPLAKLDILSNTDIFLQLKKDNSSNDYFRIINATGATNQFIPSLYGYHSSDNRQALYITGAIPSSMDNGQEPITVFDSRVEGTYVQNRPLFGWDSYGVRKMILLANGNVGIGTTNPLYKLAVDGTIAAREVKVTAESWADFVFHPTYKLRTLGEVEQFIKANSHLPEIPTAAEVKENGVSLGEMNAKLLQKVEELTLYMIEQQKMNEKQNQLINELELKLERIKNGNNL